MNEDRAFTAQSVVILGAPRSGTNILRDVLCSLDAVGTWPCDEINYIWRHGNVRHPSDEFSADMARPAVRRYIRRQFDWVARRYQANVVVEKTCANSLRVPFVDAVVPEAKFVQIVRDGVDAVGSARLRWTASLDVPYILEKARFVPVTDLPYYGSRYLWSRVHRLFSRERRLAFWGPALDDMQEILRTHTLNEVCALQWKRCVEKADKALSELAEDRVLRVRYEEFVGRPEEELRRILDFLDHLTEEEAIARAVAQVSSRSVGKGRKSLGDEEVGHLEAFVGDTLARYGYLQAASPAGGEDA